ncbi:hypothetical protein AYI70_g7033 [Smittium culicis]|uniref:Uncharacterized protein n=1 Tax=Smittium culicis TaxID=133412 RepID=A0A1R1XMB5_9FUNG|nr:hypothetical protein AYI70_g7033 [Smittium culicis]
METKNTSAYKEHSASWANVVKDRTKPSDIIRRDEKKFFPLSLYKTTMGNDPLKRKIPSLFSTSLKFGGYDEGTQ